MSCPFFLHIKNFVSIQNSRLLIFTITSCMSMRAIRESPTKYKTNVIKSQTKSKLLQTDYTYILCIVFDYKKRKEKSSTFPARGYDWREPLPNLTNRLERIVLPWPGRGTSGGLGCHSANVCGIEILNWDFITIAMQQHQLFSAYTFKKDLPFAFF